MTRKDYVAIAKVINDAQFINCTTEGELQVMKDVRRRITFELAEVFTRENSAFDAKRFQEACGLGKDGGK